MTTIGDEVTSERLLPCPFCGGEGLVHNSPGASRLWMVSCKNCDCGPHGKWSPALAIAAWNRRSTAVGSTPSEVKPLEWDDDLGTDEITAFPIFGRYWLRNVGKQWDLRLDHAAGADIYQSFLGAFNSADEGMAAGEKDYQSKMTAALSTGKE